MALDFRTVFLVHGITALALGGMLFAFWRAHRAMSWLALWGGGMALIGLGTLLIGFRDVLPDFMSIVISNAVAVAGALIVWSGIGVFNGRPPRWLPAAVLPALVFALAYWCSAHNDAAARMVVVAGMLAVVSFLCADELLRRGKRPLRPMAIVAGAPLVLDGIVLAAHALSTALHPATPGLLAASGNSIMLVPLIGRILTAFGFLMLTAERYIEERRALEGQLFQSQKMEALGTLAGGIAHDLNNVLVPLLVLGKTTAARLPDGTRERDNLNTMLRAALRARDLVGQILAFSRRDAPALESVDLAEVVREALKLLRASVPPTIAIEHRIGAVPPLLGDIGKLHQVIANLVINAVHAIAPHLGTITVEVAPTGESEDRASAPAIRLSVSDTGCGMDKTVLARIFDPFFTTKPTGTGTGLGLSVVHGIIDQHGGRIAVESNPGRGTRFDIYLPASAA